MCPRETRASGEITVPQYRHASALWKAATGVVGEGRVNVSRALSPSLPPRLPSAALKGESLFCKSGK